MFPYYKANRKANREKSKLDWGLIFESLAELREDLINNFPYKVVNVEGAEADDVIAVLAKWSQSNALLQEGLFEEPQKVLIVSSDKDFIQLQKYKNVRQWSPMQKKFLQGTQQEIYEYTITHIVKAGDDGIPNILSPDDVFVSGGRQKPIRETKVIQWLQQKPEDFCTTPDMLRNYKRNELLIDLNFIPKSVSTNIINYYQSVKPASRSDFFNYLISSGLKELTSAATDF